MSAWCFCRSREEFALGSVPAAINMPVQSIPERLNELPEDVDTPFVVFCAAGKRAALAQRFLEQVWHLCLSVS
jgi:rhodanese-related sulfurtransferase